jgi:hypothetical protein
VNLTGTSTNPVTLAPSGLSFGSVNIGSTSTAQTAVLTNNGRTTLSVTSVTASAPFAQTNNCKGSLRAGAKCNISVTFKPTAAGTATGNLTVTDSAGTQLTALSGTGVSTVTLQSITVTPANASIVAPTTQQYAATGNYSDGSHQDLTNSSTWASTNTTTATISAAGLATTGVAGATTISATSSGITGGTGLTVTHTQSGIVVSPSSASINTGDSQQFNAYPTYSDSTTGTTPVAATWISSNTAVAQVDVSGLAVGDTGGTAAISAMSGAYASSAGLAVNATNACTSNNRIDAKLLVLTSGRTEADFPAITTSLNYLHTPYDVVDFRTQTVTQSQLYSGCHAFYNGVIMAFLDGTTFEPTANTYTAYDFSTSPATPYTFNGYNVLQTFEKTFGIRQLNWFVNPAPALGFSGFETGNSEGDTATYTGNATSIFSYANQSNPLVIDPNAFVVFDTAGAGASAVLTDGASHALTLNYSFGDGREYLSNTFDSNQYMTHEQVLSYGLINWVTKGMFVGEKHVFFTPQEDDWGIDDDIWTQNNGHYLSVTGWIR